MIRHHLHWPWRHGQWNFVICSPNIDLSRNARLQAVFKKNYRLKKKIVCKSNGLCILWTKSVKSFIFFNVRPANQSFPTSCTLNPIEILWKSILNVLVLQKRKKVQGFVLFGLTLRPLHTLATVHSFTTKRKPNTPS